MKRTLYLLSLAVGALVGALVFKAPPPAHAQQGAAAFQKCEAGWTSLNAYNHNGWTYTPASTTGGQTTLCLDMNGKMYLLATRNGSPGVVRMVPLSDLPVDP